LCKLCKKHAILAAFARKRVDFDASFTPFSPVAILDCGVRRRVARLSASGEDRRKNQ
jgi:hypothetical protein